MRRIGLALSGGGFRATLYHLGVVRFLKDANLLKDVTHIASVSGGSILAAHLTLNWNRYTGSDQDFADAADEIIKFVQFDVRNHIVRRLPFHWPLRLLHRLSLGRIPLKTPNTILERYYERFLFGDTCLYELPSRPELHILATNVSEGGFSVFSREGLFIRRRRLEGDTLDFVPARMASIPKVVGASSAFPGFFPPVQITAADLGVRDGAFPTEAFTDGGVYDNLGIRAFSWLEQHHMERNSTVAVNDFTDLELVCRALAGAKANGQPKELTWIARHLTDATVRALKAESGVPREEKVECLAAGLSRIIRRFELYRDDDFAAHVPSDADAAKLLEQVRSRQDPPERGVQVWLNRHLLASALEQTIGRPMLRTYDRDLDEILVSDAGKPFQILNDTSLGFVARSMRASDILWDRVWQLERENFGRNPAFQFMPITDTVDPADDPTAMHPNIQAEVQSIRTDLDRFTPLEISSLIQHGYQVARKACKASSPLADADIPSCPPWTPFARPGGQADEETSAAEEPSRDSVPSPMRRAQPSTRDARALRRSSQRKVWSTLVELRDWTTYVYTLLLLLLIFIVPFQAYKLYRKSQMQATVIEAISAGDPDFRKILEIVDSDTMVGWQSDEIATAPSATEVDYSGLEVEVHTRIIDLRQWRPENPSPTQRGTVYMCDLVSLKKLPSYSGDNKLVLRYPFLRKNIEVRCPPDVLEPIIRTIEEPLNVAGEQRVLYEVEFDLAGTPVEQVVDLEIEFVARDLPSEYSRSRFKTELETDVISAWLLFPTDRPYRTYSLVMYPADGTTAPRMVDARFTIDHPFGSLIGWSVVNPKTNSIYECSWTSEP